MNKIILVDVPKSRLEASVLLGGCCSGRAAGAGVGLAWEGAESQGTPLNTDCVYRGQSLPLSCPQFPYLLSERRH